ncbi:MAG TPA: hypothetical protein ENF42_04030 [Candidatus Bathyarchaeota archaeon]|nr:hypothetical protein [Candidatus Bathyarchaeota archaeon]
MKELYEAVKRLKPQVLVSAYVWTVRDPYICLRDWVEWVRKGYLDAVNPSGYIYNYKEYINRCKENIEAIRRVNPRVPIFINIGVHTSHGTLKSAAEIIKWVEGARKLKADGISYFTMKTLLPYIDEVSKALFREKASVPRP